MSRPSSSGCSPRASDPGRPADAVSTILPPLPASAGAPMAGAPPVLTVAAGSLPPGLQSSGGQFEATVLPPQPGQARALVTVETAAGPVVLRDRADLALPAGTQLTLQVAGSADAVVLRLVAVNGRALGPGAVLLPGSPAPVAGPATPAPPAGGAVPPDAALPAGLTATLLRPAVPPSGAPLPPGTRLIVLIADVAPPTAGEAAAPAPASLPPMAADPGSAAPPPEAGNPTPATPSSSAPSSSASSGTTLPDMAAPEAPTPAAATASAGADQLVSLPGMVTAHAPGNLALVDTPFGTLSLPAAEALPVGAAVRFELAASPLPPPTAPAAAGPPGLGGQGWPALADAIATLAQAEDTLALQQLVRLMPQINPQLAATLSLFANALRDDDVGEIFDVVAEHGLEKAGRRDLAARLKDDLEALADESGRAVGGGDWRCFTMPLLDGAVVTPVHLYVRQPPEDGEGGASAGSRRGRENRFLVQVDLSRLGRLQLDGLVQRESKRFDLIIRTATPLPEDMRRDILGLFAATGDVVGTKGSVTFQPGGRFVDLPPAAPAGTRVSA